MAGFGTFILRARRTGTCPDITLKWLNKEGCPHGHAQTCPLYRADAVDVLLPYQRNTLTFGGHSSCMAVPCGVKRLTEAKCATTDPTGNGNMHTVENEEAAPILLSNLRGSAECSSDVIVTPAICVPAANRSMRNTVTLLQIFFSPRRQT